MEPGAFLALAVVAVVLVGFAWQARRHPVLFRMGLRNALRRRAQTAVVLLGLMVGTAIIAGSLVSGDSLGFGIRQRAYDGLGPVDVMLQLEGQLHYPEALYDDLSANATVRREVRALSPLLYEEAALSNPALRQGEPQVSFIGFDPEVNRPFGAFVTTEGRTVDGTELGPRDLYLAEDLAARLGVGKGDPVTVTFSPPPQPRVPRLHVFDGRLTASAGLCPLPPLACPYAAAPGDPATFSVPVGPGAVSMTTLVAWFGPTAERVDLDQMLRGPDGTLVANANGTPAAPDNPSVLNVTAGPDGLAEGDWSFEVRAKAAADQPFRAVALVFYEEYNLTALQEFAEQAEAAGFAPEDFAEGAGFSREARNETFSVREVVTAEGFGDFLFGQNAFARKDAVASLYGLEGKVNLILASGDLDPAKGPAREAVLTDVLPKAVNASADARESPAIRAVKVAAIKTRILDAAERAGTVFKEFLSTVGSFTVIAGVMLIVNIFVMLSEERKSELGMARAVGLARRQLVWLFCFEGLLYAIVASLLGILLGLLLSFGLIEGLNAILSSREGGTFLVIPFHVDASSLAYAFAAGFLLTLATVAVASVRVSRLNVVRAIRRIEEPPRPAGKALALLGGGLALVGVAGAAYGFLAEEFVAKILGPCLGLLGLGLVGSRFVPRRVAYPLAGGAVALFCLYSLFTFGNPDGTLNRMMGPIRGVFIVIGIVLVIIHLPGLVRGVAAVLLRIRPLVPAVRPGVAYPLGRKTRTGLTITMFALVILVVVAFSVFGATFSIDLRAHSGGYQVEGETTVPIEDLRAYFAAHPTPGLADPFAKVVRHDELRYALAFGGTMVRIEDQSIRYQGPPLDYVYTYDESFARNNDFEFDTLDPAYATAADAYLAVLRDPGLVIVSIAYNFDDEGVPGRFQPGDMLQMETPAGPRELRIVGFQRQLILGGLFVHPQVLEGNFQRVRGEYLFELAPGADADAAAKDIEAAFQEVGMDAASVDEIADAQLEQNKRFLTLFQLYLGFGLVVGIASLGIVTARAVLERRQEIGMLRAVGYSRRDVLRMLYVEIFLTTTLGVLVGSVIGLFTAYGVVASTPALSSLGVEFRVPWLDILGILALVYLAVFLATFIPARQGSRTPPAEAVRYVE